MLKTCASFRASSEPAAARPVSHSHHDTRTRATALPTVTQPIATCPCYQGASPNHKEHTGADPESFRWSATRWAAMGGSDARTPEQIEEYPMNANHLEIMKLLIDNGERFPSVATPVNPI